MSNERPGHLWAVIQEWLDSMPYPPSQRQFSERMKISNSAMTEYKYGRRMPSPAVLERIADELRVPYERVLDAVLRDRGYRRPAHLVPRGIVEDRPGNSVVLTPEEHERLRLVEPRPLPDPVREPSGDDLLAARRVNRKGGLERQADDQDADAYAPDPEGPEGGA